MKRFVVIIVVLILSVTLHGCSEKNLMNMGDKLLKEFDEREEYYIKAELKKDNKELYQAYRDSANINTEKIYEYLYSIDDVIQNLSTKDWEDIQEKYGYVNGSKIYQVVCEYNDGGKLDYETHHLRNSIMICCVEIDKVKSEGKSIEKYETQLSEIISNYSTDVLESVIKQIKSNAHKGGNWQLTLQLLRDYGHCD